jgi:hypothetical protein
METVDSKAVIPNPEWNLVDFKENGNELVQMSNFFIGKKNEIIENLSVGQFKVVIKRVSTFYVNLFMWPLVFILFITMGIFLLPPSCVERVTMGVLLLLTLVIMSLMLESYLPKTSTSISIIGRLISFNMFMVTWSTVVSTLIIGIDKDNFVYRAIPSWLKKFMLNYVAKAVCKYGTLNSIFSATRVR